MIMAKVKVFSQVIKKGLSGAEDAIMGKYLIITEMAHIQKNPHLQCNKDAHTIIVKVAQTHLMTTFNFQ